MEVRTDLQFDPASAFHTYSMVYTIVKEDLMVNCFLVKPLH